MNKIFIIGTTFLLGVGAGLIIKSQDWNGFLTSYIPALATLVAAYYGARFAFEFQNEKDLDTEKKCNISSINKTLFTLSRMANNLFVYQREVIDPVRNKPSAFLELAATPHLDKEQIRLDTESLHFILKTEFRNIASEILIEEERYRAALDAINFRSNLHLYEVQPILEKAGFKSGTTVEISNEELESILGNRLYSILLESTKQVVFHVDSTIESHKNIADKLIKNIKSIYPDESFISFTLQENSKLDAG